MGLERYFAFVAFNLRRISGTSYCGGTFLAAAVQLASGPYDFVRFGFFGIGAIGKAGKRSIWATRILTPFPLILFHGGK